MKAEFEATIKVKAVYDIDTLKGIKSNTEFAEDMARLVCDEIATAGGVGSYLIMESELNVKGLKCNLTCKAKGNECCFNCKDRFICRYACVLDPVKCNNVCN